MKFKVREGFVCYVEVAQKDGSGKVVGTVTNAHPGGSEVDFDAKTAANHKHKLEALDAKAEKFLAPAVIEQAPVVGAEVLAQLAALQAQVAALTAAQQPQK